LTFSHQVPIIYAATNGFLDDVEVGKVARFETEFNEFIGHKYGRIFEIIDSEKVLNDEAVELLDKALEEFKSQFMAGKA
jgi:F-type H+-transporting ATPase subunit alpha